VGPKIPVLEREKLILNGRSYHWITDRICSVVENKQPLLWWLLFIPSALIALIGAQIGAQNRFGPCRGQFVEKLAGRAIR